MTAATLLWIAFGSLALIIILLVIVMVARSLEKSSGAGGPTSSGETSRPAPPSHRTSSSKWTAASLNATLAAVMTESGDKTKTPEGKSTPKQIITGMAVVAGVVALIMGIVAGDG